MSAPNQPIPAPARLAVTSERAGQDVSRAALPEATGADLCRVGVSIWMNHEMTIRGTCARCGWRYPALNLRVSGAQMGENR